MKADLHFLTDVLRLTYDSYHYHKAVVRAQSRIFFWTDTSTAVIYNVSLELPWPRPWRSGIERSPRKQKIGCSNPSRDKSLQPVVAASLPNARHEV